MHVKNNINHVGRKTPWQIKRSNKQQNNQATLTPTDMNNKTLVDEDQSGQMHLEWYRE